MKRSLRRTAASTAAGCIRGTAPTPYAAAVPAGSAESTMIPTSASRSRKSCTSAASTASSPAFPIP